MSAFQVNLTPTRKPVVPKKRSDDRLPTLVKLGPFTPKAVVEFKDVPVTKTATRTLVIRSTFADTSLKIAVTKFPKPEHNISLEWTSSPLTPNGEVTMNLVWSPMTAYAVVEVIQLTDSLGNSKDVSIVLKSINNNVKKKVAAKTAKPVYKVRSPVMRNTLRKSNVSPSNKRVFGESNSQNCARPIQNPKSLNASTIFQSANSPHIENMFYPPRTVLVASKENLSPITPPEASALFNNIKFTPSTTDRSKDLDYLANRPTPQRRDSNVSNIFKNIQFTPITERDSRIDYLSELPTPGENDASRHQQSRRKLETDFPYTPYQNKKSPANNSLSNLPTPNNQHQIFVTTPENVLIRHINFSTTIKSRSESCNTDDSCHEIDIVINDGIASPSTVNNKTHTLSSSPLSAISEQDEQGNLYKTFKISLLDESKPTINKTIVVHPKVVTSESMMNLNICGELSRDQKENMRLNQGSMPDLNALNLSATSINNNRFYYERQTEEPILFKPNEIRAQSSRFNIHEIGKAKGDCSPKSPASKYLSPRAQRSTPRTPKTPRSFKKSPGPSPSFTSPSVDKCHQLNVQSIKIMSISPPKKRRMAINLRGNVLEELCDMQHSEIHQQFKKPIPTPRQFYKMCAPEKTNDNYPSIFKANPFAASSLDPFLTSTISLDISAIREYEEQFKKWLNALVTIPADLESETSEKIDLGKLFSDLKNKKLILAPTKEITSSKYFCKNRINLLRESALKLYFRNDMVTVLNKVNKQIDDKLLVQKTERDLHLDLVLQREVLELLLCFNTLWLRIGMEVIYQEEIELRSNADAYTLSAFIVSRFFNDYSKTKKTNLYSPQYKESIKKFTLKKFFALVLFLDTAKKEKLIKQDPCLFKRTAPYKETKDILSRFSSQILSGGDIIRFLKRLGYEVSHKQTYIDEFDYAFKNLAIDLRDGVRLTKVMEIISLRNDLTCQVRAPAISRLQKIHNCALGLRALSEGNYNIVGDINERDIADGHREKTLSLIWQIIYKFRAPRFNNAATTIALWWRRKWPSVLEKRRIREELLARQNAAATRIIKIWRGYITRRKFEKIRREKIAAVTVLQKHVRGMIARRNYKIECLSIVLIQRWYRNMRMCVDIRRDFQQKRRAALKIQQWYQRIIFSRKLESAAVVIRDIKIIAKERHEKAIIIQRSMKSYIIHKKLRTIVEGIVRHNRKKTHHENQVIRVQSIYRMKKCRLEFLQKRQAIIQIQQCWRNYALMKSEYKKYQHLKKCTIFVQRKFRATLKMRDERAAFQYVVKSVTTIQLKWQATLLMKKQRLEYLSQRKIIISVQRIFRATILMKIERARYQQLLSSVRLVQTVVRANILMKQERARFLQFKSATISIQRRFRANLEMRKAQNEYAQIRCSIICIQQQFRSILIMRMERNNYQTIRMKIMTIQTKWRATMAMREERNKYMVLKSATITLQTRWRATMMMQEERLRYQQMLANIKLIQSRVRANIAMKIDRANYLQLKSAACVFQQRYRANLEMRKVRDEYHQTRSIIVNMQQKYKATLQMRAERCNYQELRATIIKVQIQWRAILLMRKERAQYLADRSAIIQLQRRWRATLLMRLERIRYQQTLQSVKQIQAKVRANLSMKNDRASYLQLRSAAIVFQQHFRANLEMRRVQAEYYSIRSVIIKTQLRYRAKLEMRKERSKYQHIIQTVTNIQVRWRATLLMRSDREQYLSEKKAIVQCQRRWRATMLMRIERLRYEKTLEVVKLMQNRVRANIAQKQERDKFVQLKSAAIVLQQRYRARLEMKKSQQEYFRIRQVIIATQQRFRATLQMREDRNKYLQLVSAITIIQLKWRATIAMRSQRQEHLAQRVAVVHIQRRWRATRLMLAEREKYLSFRKTVILVQQRYRAVLQLRTDRHSYQCLRTSVTVIQRKWRVQQLMKQQRQHYLRMKEAAVIIQRRYRAQVMMIETRNRYYKLLNSITPLQAQIRGMLGRKRFREMLTPEYLEMHRRQLASIKIQTAWRGYYHRKTKQTRFMKVVAEKIRQTKINKNPHLTLENILKTSFTILAGKYKIMDAIDILLKLEKISRSVPHLLIDHASFLAGFCYGLMACAIRSEPDKKLIELCSCIVLNLARYEPTREQMFLSHSLQTVTQMLLRWCDKDCAIFNTLCTLIWIFSFSPKKNREIRSFMLGSEARARLRETQKLVLRKEKMRKNDSRPPYGCLTPPTQALMRTLPNMNADYGVAKIKPYIFYSSVFAFDTILRNLNITID